MDRATRERLGAAGWRVGDAFEFLNLTPEEQALVELRVALAMRLREVREEHGCTQVQVARRIGSSQSRVAKMEAGDPSVSLDLLLRTLFSLGVTRAEVGAVIMRAA